jgi:MFS family permease
MAGPLLGGFIVKWLSWRWVFYINVPFGLMAAGLLGVALRENVERRPHRFDVFGALTLAAAILAVLLGVSGFAPWPMLVLGAVLVWTFVAIERRVPEPVLPLDLASRRIIAVGSLGGAVAGAALMATMMFVPLFVQAVLGGTPSEAGTTVTPMLIGWPIASAASGRLLTRIGFRPLVRTGFVVVAVAALAAWLLLRPDGGTWPVRGAMMLFGVGLGLANTALLIAVQDSVTWSQRGVATATTMFSRNLGGAIAVGALGALLSSSLGSNVPKGELDHLVNQRLHGVIDRELAARLVGDLAVGLSRVFLAVVFIALLGVLAGIIFPKSRPRSQPEPSEGTAPAK